MPHETSVDVVRNPVRLSAASDFLQLLATLFRLPTAVLSDSLVNETLRMEINLILNDFFGKANNEELQLGYDLLVIAAQDNNAHLSVLRSTYTSLFTHPVKPQISLYESLFLFWEKDPEGSYADAPRLFISPAALSAERIYKKAGLKRSKEVNESADHISTEMEFMARLYAYKGKLMVEGEDEEEEEEGTAVDQVISEFMHYHVKKWWPKFFEKLALTDTHPLYGAIGLIGNIWINTLLRKGDIS
jgi:TorA maturation chaperone TorD